MIKQDLHIENIEMLRYIAPESMLSSKAGRMRLIGSRTVKGGKFQYHLRSDSGAKFYFLSELSYGEMKAINNTLRSEIDRMKAKQLKLVIR